MSDEITIRRLRGAFRDVGIVFDEYAEHNGTLFRLKGDSNCDGVSIRVLDDRLVLWVQDGFLPAPLGEGLSELYDGFAKQWTNGHPGLSAHLLNPFREEGAAPACKATYPIPSTSVGLKKLLRDKILAIDLKAALGFCREIQEWVKES